jgi:hypothetical protein
MRNSVREIFEELGQGIRKFRVLGIVSESKK